MAQVLISRLVQEVNLSWLHPWMDYGKHFIVAMPSVHWSLTVDPVVIVISKFHISIFFAHANWCVP